MKRARRTLNSLDDDIRDHIERETRDNLDRGMAPEEARRQAILKFGNVALVKEATRAIWGWQRLEQLAQDCWYAIRILRRRPVYALLSVLTLALGIGGTASVYGVAHGVLLSPLPYAHEREIGVFWMKTDWTHEEYCTSVDGRLGSARWRSIASATRCFALAERQHAWCLVSPHRPSSSTCSALLPSSDVDSMRATTSRAPSVWPC